MESKDIELNPIPYKVTNHYHIQSLEWDVRHNLLIFATGLLIGYLVGLCLPLQVSVAS